MDINKEEIFDQLQQFEEKYSDGKIPESLENYLKHVAKTGDILFPWPSVKPLLRKKVELVLDEFNEKAPISATMCPAFNFDEVKQDIIKSLDSFYGAPFTIQRICELLTVPSKHYKRTDKFMRGLEKNVLVVSHVDEQSNAAAQAIPTAPKSIFSTDAFATFGSDGDYHSSSSSSNSRSSIIDPFENPEPGTSSASSNHVSSASNKIIISHRPASPSSPAPLQQLDSFTTVFSSPPSTPLAVVTNMAPFESASSSSSGSSSSDGSSTGDSSPRPLDESPESKEDAADSPPVSEAPSAPVEVPEVVPMVTHDPVTGPLEVPVETPIEAVNPKGTVTTEAMEQTECVTVPPSEESVEMSTPSIGDPSSDNLNNTGDDSPSVSSNGAMSNVRKPLNAFQIFAKEHGIQENLPLGQGYNIKREWHNLPREEQSRYYDMAREENQRLSATPTTTDEDIVMKSETAATVQESAVTEQSEPTVPNQPEPVPQEENVESHPKSVLDSLPSIDV